MKFKRTVVFLSAAVSILVFGRIGLNRYYNNKAVFSKRGLVTVFVPTLPPESSFYAGSAEAVITPRGQVYLGGFQWDRRSTGLYDNLFAKVLILEDFRGEKTAIISLDLLGFLRHDVNVVRHEIARRGILRPENIFITATHQHSGPDPIGLWGRMPFLGMSGRDHHYLAWVDSVIIALIEEADQNLEPVNLFVGQADGRGFCRNRRQPKIIDEEIRTLFVVNRDGNTVSSLVNFGCHPEMLSGDNTLITADFPSALYETVEQRLGGTVIFVNGALGGMVTPTTILTATKSKNFDSMKEFGILLGERVAQSFHNRERLTVGPINVQPAALEIPLKNKMFRLALFLGTIPNSGFRKGMVVTEINFLQISELNIITVPGEILPNLGLAIKAMLPEPKMLWSLTNDEIGYILREDDYYNRLYNYERSMSVGPLAGEAILSAAERLIRAAP